MVVLRKYQKEGVRKIVDAWKSEKDNCRSVIFQNPMVSVLLLLRKNLAYDLYAGEGAHSVYGKKHSLTVHLQERSVLYYSNE
jgi:hypothetical protein